MMYEAQSARNNPVKIHTGEPGRAAALYIRTLGKCNAIEHVTVTAPEGTQTVHDVDTGAELDTSWIKTAGDAWSSAA